MTSASEKKWRSYNCFFSWVGLRTYQQPCAPLTLYLVEKSRYISAMNCCFSGTLPVLSHYPPNYFPLPTQLCSVTHPVIFRYPPSFLVPIQLFSGTHPVIFRYPPNYFSLPAKLFSGTHPINFRCPPSYFPVPTQLFSGTHPVNFRCPPNYFPLSTQLFSGTHPVIFRYPPSYFPVPIQFLTRAACALVNVEWKWTVLVSFSLCYESGQSCITLSAFTWGNGENNDRGN